MKTRTGFQRSVALGILGAAALLATSGPVAADPMYVAGQPTRCQEYEHCLEIMLYFRSCSTQLLPNNIQNQDALNDALLLISSCNDAFYIDGHTCSGLCGTIDNCDLAEGRAQALKWILVQRGIDPNRLIVRKYGAKFPAYMPPTNTLNRRVVIRKTGYTGEQLDTAIQCH